VRAIAILLFGCALFGQTQSSTTPPSPPAQTAAPQTTAPGFKARPQEPAPTASYTVPPGTKVLLSMVNSVSTKQAQVGDRIYLETAFPVLANGKIVVPQGSWVTGTVTEVQRPKRGHGRGELQIRFDSLTLPNGVSRDFRGDLSSVDARNKETLNKSEGTVKGGGDAGTKVAVIGSGAAIGAGLGTVGGAKGLGIGAGAGAAAGLIGTMFMRAPDAMLTKGSNVEMVLDRPLTYSDSDLNFSNAPPRTATNDGGGPQTEQQRRLPRLGIPIP